MQHSLYFSIVADEVTDSSNKQQVVIRFRSVDEQFEGHDKFVGLHQVDSIKSSGIVEVLNDTIVRLNLAISNCRGQYYDGTANMASIWNGVIVQICAEEPQALYLHCYSHALNLAASDTVKKNKIFHDVLDTVFIIKLLGFSPQHHSLATKLKEEITPGTPGFHTLGPTHWPVCAASLKSVTDMLLSLTGSLGRGEAHSHCP